VPVLAIAAHIPSGEIGSGYFQETSPDKLFAECSHFVGPVATVSQIGRTLDIASQARRLGRGDPGRRRARGHRGRGRRALAEAGAASSAQPTPSSTRSPRSSMARRA
jgi:hypothetical protein